MSPKTTKAKGPGSSEDNSNSMSMSSDEINFLIDCLKYPVGGGSVAIDVKAVAEARGQKNAGSVSNRILKMKKKYNLPIGASGCGPKKLSPSAESKASKNAKEVQVPMTPSKNRITKTRGRAIPVKKNPNAKYFGYDSDGNNTGLQANVKTMLDGYESDEEDVTETAGEDDAGEGYDKEEYGEESGMESEIHEVKEQTEA